MKCPRRVEGPFKLPESDEWREDDTCSYCGSMKPDVVFALLEAGAEITPTDKSYKAYLKNPKKDNGFGKIYFQHFDVEQKMRFVEMLNAGTMNIGYPGRFYVLPFFVTR